MREHKAPGLWERVTSHDALQLAWLKVHANGGSRGGDGVGLGEFRRELFANLTELRTDLLSGTYRSGPFRRVSVPKKKPGYRILTIPSVRDRVLHTSIANVLNPILEPMFEDGSFGYRPNRGVQQAAARIEQWHKRGYDYVIEADIVSYFDNVDQELLSEKLATAIAPLDGASPVIALIDRLLVDQAQALGTPGRGIVQGSPLSPLLSNLYLDALDEEIEAQGVKIIRFADDFVILCKSRRKAEKVLAHCIKVLAEHQLRLHDDGTRIVNFDRGFDFIGYLFVRSMALRKQRGPAEPAPAKPIKSEVTDEGIIELDGNGSRFDPGRRVLYVLDPEHRLRTRNRSFSVCRDNESELITIPHRRAGRIELGPGVSYSQSAIELALDTGVGVSVIDGFGQTRGLISASASRRAGLQFAQARAIAEAGTRVSIARKLVDARIRNQRTQLLRLNRKRAVPEVVLALRDMKRQLQGVAGHSSVDHLLGAEGAASAIYWGALGRLADCCGSREFRRSRPARDPLNATMNYLTGILERDVRAAIQFCGLHTGFAFLHSARDGHDGLVYDQMEPFRAPLTEGLAIFLFNARRLRDDMFSNGVGHEVLIGSEGRKAIVEGYEVAVGHRINKTGEPGKLGWRAMMVHQSRSLARAVRRSDPDLFRPYLMEP